MSKERMSISSETSFKLLHSLRSRHDGILIGINTLVCDEVKRVNEHPYTFGSFFLSYLQLVVFTSRS